MEEIKKTSEGIRELLFNELDELRHGKVSPQRANAVARTVSTIIASVKLEMEYARLIQDNGKAFKVCPLSLGNASE